MNHGVVSLLHAVPNCCTCLCTAHQAIKDRQHNNGHAAAHAQRPPTHIFKLGTLDCRWVSEWFTQKRPPRGIWGDKISWWTASQTQVNLIDVILWKHFHFNQTISLHCVVQCINGLAMLCTIHLGVDCSSLLKQNPGLIVLALVSMDESHVVLGVGTAHNEPRQGIFS